MSKTWADQVSNSQASTLYGCVKPSNRAVITREMLTHRVIHQLGWSPRILHWQLPISMAAVISFSFAFFRKAQKSRCLYSYSKSMPRLQSPAGNCYQHIMPAVISHKTSLPHSRYRPDLGVAQQKDPCSQDSFRRKNKNRNHLVLRAFKKLLTRPHITATNTQSMLKRPGLPSLQGCSQPP